eukprot:15001370-Alexandrium_andersonii.AAC.1
MCIRDRSAPRQLARSRASGSRIHCCASGSATSAPRSRLRCSRSRRRRPGRRAPGSVLTVWKRASHCGGQVER